MVESSALFLYGTSEINCPPNSNELRIHTLSHKKTPFNGLSDMATLVSGCSAYVNVFLVLLLRKLNTVAVKISSGGSYVNDARDCAFSFG